ncbi:MAG: RNA polymerase factor sigma-54 [Bacteroidota bacterium]
MLNIGQQQQFQQKLTPQQVQFLKLLQIPTAALEQRIKLELETNPFLEEGTEEEPELTEAVEEPQEQAEEPYSDTQEDGKDEKAEEEPLSLEDFMNDDPSAYRRPHEEEERDEFPIPAQQSMVEHLLDQLHLLDLSADERRLGEEIIWNIDEDGYLRRDLDLIVQQLNSNEGFDLTIDQAENVLKKIQQLDPVGIGARTLQECLLAQLEADTSDPNVKEIARKILENHFNEFTKKHFEELRRHLRTTRETLKKAVELIQRLNPKPGEGDFTPQENYLTPDFLIENVNGELVVLLNDKDVPPLRINKAYRQFLSRRKKDGISPEVKQFLRKKLEAAKWFITAIYQRRETMMKVMKAIVERQREFFEHGEEYLKPMIYKDIANAIGMDISTISRVVNGKYVQTDHGVFELRYFFSDGINTSSGEKMSNKGVRIRIKQIIDGEDPNHPLSDDDITRILRKEGINVARRTVAKYREQMLIPVARLRRKV